MPPFVTEDYEIIKAYSDFTNIALLRVNETGNITDINECAGTLFNMSAASVINTSLTHFCEQYQFDMPQNGHTAQYQRSHFEHLTLQWQIHHLDDNQVITAEVLDSAFHTAFFNDQLFGMLNKMPIAIYCKDLYGIYVETNDYCNRIALGETCNTSIVGRVDNDLTWADTAAILQAHDRRVYQGKTYQFEEQVILANGANECMQSIKSPLVDDNNHVIGMVGISINKSLLKPPQNQPNHQQFSTREQECLKLLANGHTVREVGELLGISKRTAEAHINHIKAKTKTFKLFQTGFIIGQDRHIDLL